MSEPFIGQVIAVGFNFAPISWVPCDGRLLPISEYSTLYALIGTTYGGDGQSTFAVPDMRSRVAVGQGQGPGLSNYILGQKAGSESVTLTATTTPAHTHTPMAAAVGTAGDPAPTLVFGGTQSTTSMLYDNPSALLTLAPTTVSTAGGSQPHENRQPVLAINYIICAEGIYPSQP